MSIRIFIRTSSSLSLVAMPAMSDINSRNYSFNNWFLFITKRRETFDKLTLITSSCGRVLYGNQCVRVQRARSSSTKWSWILTDVYMHSLETKNIQPIKRDTVMEKSWNARDDLLNCFIPAEKEYRSIACYRDRVGAWWERWSEFLGEHRMSASSSRRRCCPKDSPTWLSVVLADKGFWRIVWFSLRPALTYRLVLLFFFSLANLIVTSIRREYFHSDVSRKTLNIVWSKRYELIDECKHIIYIRLIPVYASK